MHNASWYKIPERKQWYMKKARLEYAIEEILACNIYKINKKNNEIGCILEKGVVLDLQDINEIKK